MKAGKLVIAAVLAVGVGLGVQPAYAHAFGERYDLPIPLNFFLVGGAATVALSFVVIGLFVQRRPETFSYPRYNLLQIPIIGDLLQGCFPRQKSRLLFVRLSIGFILITILLTSLVWLAIGAATLQNMPVLVTWLIGVSIAVGSILWGLFFLVLLSIVLGTIFRGSFFIFLVQIASVFVFGLAIATSLIGENRALDNFSPIFIWIIWWVGMGYIAALLGNLWILVNPWKITFEWAERLLPKTPSGEYRGIYRYPEKWDVWPAVALFLIFAWLENVYDGATIPFELGILIILYSLITWAGMALFGKHTWLRHGEAFSVLFSFFARFSPTEVRVPDAWVCSRCQNECDVADDGCVDCYECFERAHKEQREFNVRPFAVNLARPGKVTTATAAFVVLALATVSFDGLQETPTWVRFQGNVAEAIEGLFGSSAIDVIDTAGVILIPMIFMLVYLAFSWGIKRLSNDSETVAEVARAFVFSLVPIALAYNLAHFLSFLVIQGQLIIPLISDPFGFGWDIFGTVDYRVNIAVINARFVWFVSVAAIVLGHIISVYIAHVISLRRAPSHIIAIRGQYPMLALMVFYTATSLWILAQPIVES